MTLANATITFDTTTDNLDPDTQLIIEVRDAYRRLAARYSGYPGGDGMESGMQKLIPIPIQNPRATADELVAGEVEIAIRPDDSGVFNRGHDTWKFNWSLLLEFNDHAPLDSGQMQSATLSQDRNTLRQGLRGIFPATDRFPLASSLHPIKVTTTIEYAIERLVGVDFVSQTVYAEELLRYGSHMDDEVLKVAAVSLQRGIDDRFNIRGHPYSQVLLNFRLDLARQLMPEDPRIEIFAQALGGQTLPCTVILPRNGENYGFATIWFAPEAIQPGTTLVFAANFESGRGGIIAQHQVNLTKTVIFPGGVIDAPRREEHPR